MYWKNITFLVKRKYKKENSNVNIFTWNLSDEYNKEFNKNKDTKEKKLFLNMVIYYMINV